MNSILLESNVECSVLNRQQLNTSNICGPCKYGWSGSYDATNTACIEVSKLKVTNKKCPNNCNGNGTCSYTSISFGTTVNDCNMLSSSCYSSCYCDSDLFGRDCSLTNDELENIKFLQFDKLTNLANMATNSLLNKEALQYLIPTSSDIVKSLSIGTSISSDVIDKCSTIVSNTMDKARSLELPSSSIMVYTDAISSITPLMLNIDDSVSMNKFQDMYENFFDTLTVMSAVQVKVMQEIVLSESDNMVALIKPLETENAISSLGLYPNRMTFLGSGEALRRLTSGKANITVGMSVTRAYIYRNLYPTCTNCSSSETIQNTIASNPIRINLNCSEMPASILIFEIQNFESQTYRVLRSSDEFRTVCKKGVAKSYVYKCSYPDSNTYEMIVDCDGKSNTVYSTKCPDRTVKPTCDIVTSKSLGSCSLLKYNTTTLSCFCTVCESSMSSRRLVTVADSKLDAFRVASVTRYVFEKYTSTMESAKTVNENDFRSTLIVSFSFISLWLTVFTLISIQAYRKKLLSKKVDSDMNKAVVPDDDSHSMDRAKKLFKDYIVSFFPLIYKDDKNVNQFAATIMNSHPYFSLLSNSRTTLAYSNRWIQGFQLCTIISAKMFILAMLFDVRYPMDDGSCSRFDSKSSCLFRKSAFSTYCSWIDDSCQFNNPDMDLMSVAILGWLCLLTSAPCKTFISFVFDYVICAATPKYVEEQIKETSVYKRFRRMSANLGRRISHLIQHAQVQELLSNVKRSVKSTMIVNSEFIQMRRSVVELLETTNNNNNNSNSNNNNKRNEDSSIEATPEHKAVVVHNLCHEFVQKFNYYRNSLEGHAKEEFDEKWAFFRDTSGVTGTSSKVVPLNNDGDRHGNNIMSDSIFHIIFSEIDAVYSRSSKVLGSYYICYLPPL